MRTSKRVLAGIAAGALGAGVLAFVTAPAAQAGVATTVAWDYPSISLVATGMTGGNNPGALTAPVRLYDASGDLVSSADDTVGRAVQITVTAPTTADYDDSVVASVGGSSGINVSSANATSLAATSVNVTGISNWASLIGVDGAGTYTLTATLINTNNGAVLSTATMPLSVATNSGASGAFFSWLNSQQNVIGAIGVDADDSVANQSFLLTNSAGGRYVIIDDSIGFATSPSTLSVGTPTVSAAAGATPGFYTMTAGSGSTTGAAGVKNLIGTVTTASTVGTGTLTYNVASVDPASGSFAYLGSAPQYWNGTDDTYQVPPGTTKLDFVYSLTNSAATGTVAWNASSNATGGTVTPAGGASAVVVDNGSVSVEVNAKAAAAGKVVQFTLGAAGAANLYNVWVVFTAPAATVVTDAPIAKISTAAPIPGTITDQYGNVLPGTWAIRLLNGSASCSASVTAIATTTAKADGSFEVTVPAAYSSATPGVATYTVCASNGFSTAGSAGNTTVTFTTTGGVSSLTALGYLASNVQATSLPVVQVPGTGVVTTTSAALTSQSQTATTTLTPSVISAAGTAFKLTATVNPISTVNFTGSDGVMFTTQSAGSLLWSAGASSESVLATLTSGTTGASTVYVYATKPGTHTVTMTAGTTSTTFAFKAGVARGSIRTLTADPASIAIAPNEFKALSVIGKDIFGNAVPDDTSITASLAGGGTTSPSQPIAVGSLTTDAAGKVTVYYTAPLGTGVGKLIWTANTYISGVIPGAPAAVYQASTDIAVTTGADKTIVIVGERGTVSGKNGILVDGATTGFASGKTVIPYVRFPGGEYTQGTARPAISAAGDFEWSRKTGKKAYVYFTSDDGAVPSNRIIIAAS